MPGKGKDFSSLAGEELLKAMDEWAERRESLAEDRTKLAQFRTRLAQFRNKLAEIRTRMSGGRTGLAQSRTNLSQYRTILAKQRTELSYLRTGATLIALGTFFTRYFGLGYWSIIDGLILFTGVTSIVMAVKLFRKSFFIERRLLIRLEEELASEAVEKRMEDAIQTHRFGSF